LENYLLVPTAIRRAICDRLKEREALGSEQVSTSLTVNWQMRKSTILSQRIANRMRFFAGRTARDPSTIATEAIAALDEDWSSERRRLLAVPGKQFLAVFNKRLQLRFHVSITAAQIIRHMSRDEIGSDLQHILERLNHFSLGQSLEVH
jgi:hypothetical protein